MTGLSASRRWSSVQDQNKKKFSTKISNSISEAVTFAQYLKWLDISFMEPTLATGTN